MGNRIINGCPFDFSLSGLWLFTVVSLFVDDTDCLWVVRAFVFAYSIRSRACARTFASRRTDLFSLFAVLYRVRWIVGVHAFRFADIGQSDSSSCVVIRCMVYMGFGFLRVNLIYCSPF